MPKEISLLNLAAIIEARMLDIIDFVMAEIKASGCQQKLGAGVVLTGGAAQMKDLDLLFKTLYRDRRTRRYARYGHRAGKHRVPHRIPRWLRQWACC